VGLDTEVGKPPSPQIGQHYIIFIRERRPCTHLTMAQHLFPLRLLHPVFPAVRCRHLIAGTCWTSSSAPSRARTPRCALTRSGDGHRRDVVPATSELFVGGTSPRNRVALPVVPEPSPPRPPGHRRQCTALLAGAVSSSATRGYPELRGGSWSGGRDSPAPRFGTKGTARRRQKGLGRSQAGRAAPPQVPAGQSTELAHCGSVGKAPCVQAFTDAAAVLQVSD
jgi:hypothetical protein